MLVEIFDFVALQAALAEEAAENLTLWELHEADVDELEIILIFGSDFGSNFEISSRSLAGWRNRFENSSFGGISGEKRVVRS